jgi:limonene-1,2-epoxide hydrolase
MQPKELIHRWVEAFNKADVDTLSSLYAEDAVNHQVNQDPVRGRAAIRAMFEKEFATANMTCIVEQVFQDGEWGILEWRDPNGLRGCGFFHVVNNQIAFQRGYWDRLTFLCLHGLPIPQEPFRRPSANEAVDSSAS